MEFIMRRLRCKTAALRLPLRLLHPRTRLAHCTQIDLGKINLSAIGPNFFARVKTDKKKGEEAFFKKVCSAHSQSCIFASYWCRCRCLLVTRRAVGD